jgi:poly(hydroxyalkanoate) depolymerase family esterase
MGRMGKRKRAGGWAGIVSRNVQAVSQLALRMGRVAARQSAARAAKPTPVKRAPAKRAPVRSAERWLAGTAAGAAGARRYHLFVPAGLRAGEAPPLLVMLHGCAQDGLGFARSTRMNAIAQREGFLVLYPEQDRLANAQGCWNWFETRAGRAQGEAALVVAAIDQVIGRHRADASRVAICGLSAGASLAALVAARHPDRFAAVAMHSGVRPGAAQSGATALAAMQGRRRSTTWTPPEHLLPPLLVIQGTADPVVVRANARAAAHAWAHAGDAREPAPVRECAERRVQRGSRKAMRIVDFKRRTALLACLIEIDGLGHAWSGGAAGQPYSDPGGPDASRVIWAFAARQFKRRSP